MADTADLVKRLRSKLRKESPIHYARVPDEDCIEAANRIEALEAENARLRNAAAKALDYLTCSHPHKSAAGNDRLPVAKELHAALGEKP
jgi:hypothetical protein